MNTPFSSPPTPRSREAAVTSVVSAVADAEGVSPLELTPLATAVDEGVIEALSQPDSEPVEFTYLGYQVRAYGRHQVSVTDPSD